MARVDDPSVEEYSALPGVHLKTQVLLTRHEKVPDIKARLEADDVAAQKAAQDCIAHALGEHLPVLRRRPRDVNEVLDDRPRKLLTDDLGNEIELVIVNEDERPVGHQPAHLHHLLRDLLVHLHVTVLPRLVDRTIDDRLMCKVPEVVLYEPEHRV